MEDRMANALSSWHVGIAAEAIAAAQFARCGYDVSVQYGANQPEYDLIVARGDEMLKVSVKGSQDGSWGLCQSYLERGRADYRQAIDRWLGKHKPLTVFCFVQFSGAALDQLPRLYLATPEEVAQRLRDTAGGRGDTILYERHTWGPRAYGWGTTDEIPSSWTFTASRIAELFGTARSESNSSQDPGYP
jgi:Holliday junction resolvase-like predicted endonuclease